MQYQQEGRYPATELRYFELLTRICLQKALLLRDLQRAYRVNDRVYLKEAAQKTLPALTKDYEDFIDVVCKRWRANSRIQNLDIVTANLYAARGRTEYAAKTLRAFLDGELDRVEELEIERIPGAYMMAPCIQSYMGSRAC